MTRKNPPNILKTVGFPGITFSIFAQMKSVDWVVSLVFNHSGADLSRKKNRWAWRCGGSTCDLVPWKRWEHPGWKTLTTVFWPENQGWLLKKYKLNGHLQNIPGNGKTEVSKRFIDLKNATNAWGASGSWKFRLGIPTEFCPARRKGLRECIKGLSVVVDNPSNPLLLISMRPLSISSWIRGWLWQGRISYIPKITSRWFKVPFSSPSWRSLNPLKGSLNHPKKVTLNHQVVAMFFFSFFFERTVTSYPCNSQADH